MSLRRRGGHSWNLDSLKWRILSVVLVSAVGFAVYLWIHIAETRPQAALLEQIRNQHYPLQAQLQQAIFSLKQTQAELEQSAITGEPDRLFEAKKHAETFQNTLDTVFVLGKFPKSAIDNIREPFDNYFGNGYELASTMAVTMHPPEDVIARVRENQNAFRQVMALLESFEHKEKTAFTTSVDNVTERANALIRRVFVTGMVTVVLVFLVAAFLIRSVLGRIGFMVNTLRTIAEGTSDTSARIPITKQDEMSELAYWFNSFIDKLEQSGKELERLAYTDTLTDLPNRRSFNRILKREMEGCLRHPDRALSILFMDLDNFKYVNDHLGHDAGDILLAEVANRLQGTLRARDQVALNRSGGESVVARMGGDEFMLLLSGLRHPSDAGIVAERIRKAVLEPVVIEGQSLNVGVSIGIASYPGTAKTAEDLTINADLAMYEAKKSGKNSYCFFDEDVGIAAQQNLKIENLLRQALREDKLDLYLQPKFLISTGKLSGAEVLLRWNSEELGFVLPGVFIPVAENSNLICDLDHWVLEKTCQLINRWQRDNIFTLPISMNISAKLAGSKDLVGAVEKTLEKYPLLERSLELEITETSVIENFDNVAINIHGLKALFVKVALDDFGAGHSSLSLLKHCDVDTLKIDRGFVGEMESVKNSRSIVESLILLSKKINVEVVAEGVETESQLKILKDINCCCAQGYLLARPMPLSDFEDFAKKQSSI
ncbi:EAL domain-containing protein [Porticoccus sp. GXU_MW_L64]